MIDALIFSRDRPMQLDACLRSLAENASQVGLPTVLWMATTAAFSQGYDVLRREHPDVCFVSEMQFAENKRLILRLSRPYVLLQCDDAITYRKLPDGPIEDALQDDVLMFTLRLGANTHYCHPRDLLHDVPKLDPRGPFVVWDWNDTPDGSAFEHEGREGDFGYPYSVDGTVHRR